MDWEILYKIVQAPNTQDNFYKTPMIMVKPSIPIKHIDFYHTWVFITYGFLLHMGFYYTLYVQNHVHSH